MADEIAQALLLGTATQEGVSAAVNRVAATAELPFGFVADAIHERVSKDQRLRSAPPDDALEAQLQALHLLAPVSHVSLWLPHGRGGTCIARVGWSPPGQRLQKAASAVFRSSPGADGDGEQGLWGTRVENGSGLLAALLVQARRGQRAHARVPAERAAVAIAHSLERRLLLAQVAEAGERLLDAADRRIARLGFDIHDGPLQRLSLLAGDLASLDRALGRISPGDEASSLARQRVGEIAFTLGETQRELRDLTLSAANSGTGLLADDLGREVVRFGNRTGVRVRLKVAGDIERTTRSQRLAVHRVVEESLANIREHAHASSVQVSIRRKTGLLHLTVKDDGRGFDVGRALRRASRDGRLGLVAMAERVRFLGGELEISSNPGGPTTVSATLPAWELPAA